MDNLWKHSFIVTDVETTGNDPKTDSLIEIACVVVKGGEITREYSSLVKPNSFIPSYISNMTGISNKLAATAPPLYEIFDDLSNVFDDKKSVFVAHNVKFDWKFVSEIFVKQGVGVPAIPQLCTNKLAKVLLPNEIKKSVGALAEYFDIHMPHKHRALADARATAKILIELIELAQSNHSVYNVTELLDIQNKRRQNFKINNPTYNYLKKKLLRIPEKPGVYKFFDEGGKLIYVGKSKNLYQRVNNYFVNSSLNSRKMQELVNCINNIEWLETISELSALILETKLIIKHKPYFNKINKESRKYPFIKITNNELFPKVILSYDIENDGAEYFGPFRNTSLVEALIQIIDDNFSLVKCELPRPSGSKIPCTYFNLNKCPGPCINEVKDSEYQLELNNVRSFLNGLSNDIIGKLEEKMSSESLNMEYESAAKVRDQIKDLSVLFNYCIDMPVSINKNNFIFIIKNPDNNKLINIYYIFEGLLAKEEIIIKNNFDNIYNNLHFIYFKNKITKNHKNNIEEIRLINSWVHKYKEEGILITTYDKSIEELNSEVLSSLNEFVDS